MRNSSNYTKEHDEKKEERTNEFNQYYSNWLPQI